MKKSIKKALIILSVILAILIGVSATLFAMNRPYNSDDNTYVNVTIAEGSSTADIAETLKKEGLISSTTSFKLLSKLWRNDGKYQAGHYALSPSMRSSELADVIIAGQTNTNTITIPNGSTIDEIGDTLAESGIVDKDKFQAALTSGDYSQFAFLKNAQQGDEHLEGYLFPDTYQIDVDASEEQIIITMLNQFDTVFNDKYKDEAKEMGRSVNEIVIVASIIEKEASNDADRAKLASVIYNRLDAGMPLEMASTLKYTLGDKKVLTDADKQIDSPYNTYNKPGLPAGPICNPGKASLEAALAPEDTDFLYFAMSEKLDGSLNFSNAYDQFLKDSAAYEEALKSKGSKNN